MTDEVREYRNMDGLKAALKRKTEQLEEVHGWLTDARASQKKYDGLLAYKNLLIKILVRSLHDKTGVSIESIMDQLKMKAAEITPKKPKEEQVIVADGITPMEELTSDHIEPTDGCSQG